MLIDVVIRTWIYASTTYFTYSKSTAGGGITKAAFSLAGTVLAGWVGLEIMWVTPLDIASSTYLVATISTVVFGVLCSPKLFGLPSDIANNFSSTLMSVVSWSFAKGTRDAATAASFTLIVGTGLGIVMAFLLGALLFPQTATSQLLGKQKKVLGQLSRHVSSSLRLAAAALDPLEVAAPLLIIEDNHLERPDNGRGSPSRSNKQQSSSAEEEGRGGAASSASGLLAIASQRMRAELQQYLEIKIKITDLLDDSQNEAYVKLWRGAHIVVPCWPCRCSNFPKARLVAMQGAVTTVVVSAAKLADTFRSRLTLKMFSDLGKQQGFPVDAVSRIADLVFFCAEDLEGAFPASMALGSALLPRSENLKSLVDEVTRLLRQESEMRDAAMYRSAATRRLMRRDQQQQPGSLHEYFGWLSLLHSIEAITTGLVRLRVTLCAFVVELPWFDPSELAKIMGSGTSSSSEVAEVKRAILCTADLLGKMMGSAIGMEDARALMIAMEEPMPRGDGRGEDYDGDGDAERGAAKGKSTSRSDGGGFGGLA